jgi:hypothetical protein
MADAYVIATNGSWPNKGTLVNQSINFSSGGLSCSGAPPNCLQATWANTSGDQMCEPWSTDGRCYYVAFRMILPNNISRWVRAYPRAVGSSYWLPVGYTGPGWNSTWRSWDVLYAQQGWPLFLGEPTQTGGGSSGGTVDVDVLVTSMVEGLRKLFHPTYTEKAVPVLEAHEEGTSYLSALLPHDQDRTSRTPTWGTEMPMASVEHLRTWDDPVSEGTPIELDLTQLPMTATLLKVGGIIVVLALVAFLIKRLVPQLDVVARMNLQWRNGQR